MIRIQKVVFLLGLLLLSTGYAVDNEVLSQIKQALSDPKLEQSTPRSALQSNLQSPRRHPVQATQTNQVFQTPPPKAASPSDLSKTIRNYQNVLTHQSHVFPGIRQAGTETHHSVAAGAQVNSNAIQKAAFSALLKDLML